MPPSPRFDIASDHPQAALIAERAEAAAARIRLNARDAAAWAELTALAIEAGDPAAASAFGAEASRLDRRNPMVAYLCGRAARAQDDLPAAVQHYQRALKLEPRFLEALVSLATAERARGRFQEALSALEQAYRLDPARGDILINVGNVMADLEDWPEAARAFEMALARLPGHPVARLGLASARVRMGDFAGARDVLEGLEGADAVLAFHRDRLLGRCLWLLGEHASARIRWAQAWKTGLAHAGLHGELLMRLIVECEDPTAGLPVLAALRTHPDTPAALGALIDLCETDIRIHALDLETAWPRLADHLDRGDVPVDFTFSLLHWAMRSRDPERARRCIDASLQACINDQHPEIAFTAGVALLRLGDHARGIALYEKRLEGAAVRGMHNRLTRMGPRWQGEALDGRRLLVWQEQGHGDLLQMLRFLPQLKMHGAGAVNLLVQAPMLRLVQAQDGVDACSTIPAELPPHDLHTPDMSLMALQMRDLDGLPAAPAYLRPPPESLQHWHSRLPACNSALRVALVWAGNPNLDADRFRSVPPSDLEPLTAVPGVQWFNLQMGKPAAEFAGEPPFACEDVRNELRDFADTAGLFAHMDLVISVDSAPAHLAAALGRPTWLLNRSSSEWRWMIGREDSPWYPSLRIFNQHEPRQWREVIERVAEALMQLVSEGPQR